MAFQYPYQNQYYPAYQQNYQPQSNQQNGLIWVQGEAGAKSFLVAPNTTVQLWDSEKQRIYLKSADASGMPSMKVLDYTIAESSGNAQGSVSVASVAQEQRVTREDIEALQSQISGIKKQIEKLRKVADDE